ncbi:MAG TPA: hypothetical protein VGJ86_09950 [Acidimicrobiales bacterium]|jgi:hypothetical protein
MAYIALASAKASPGVTTTIAALAATWPQDRGLLIVELDPAGGDLAVRFDLSPEPGLVSLAAAGRRDLDPDTLLAHTQALPGQAGGGGGGRQQGRHHAQAFGRRVLAGPVAAEQAGVAIAALKDRLPRVLATMGMDVLVDCGRLDHASPAEKIAVQAALLVVVSRPVVTEVHHLASRMTSLEPRALSLLLIGERPYSVEEVAHTIGAAPLATLPDDPRAATAWSVGHPDALRMLRRSRLLRSAHMLSEGLAAWLGPAGVDTVAGMRTGAPGVPSTVAPAHAPPPPPPPPPAGSPQPDTTLPPMRGAAMGSPSGAYSGPSGASTNAGAGAGGRSANSGRRRLPVPPKAPPLRNPTPPYGIWLQERRGNGDAPSPSAEDLHR